MYISEYIYRPMEEKGFKLCSLPPSSQWHRRAKVNLILPVKNQGKWVLHLLKNLEDVRAEPHHMHIANTPHAHSKHATRT